MAAASAAATAVLPLMRHPTPSETRCSASTDLSNAAHVSKPHRIGGPPPDVSNDATWTPAGGGAGAGAGARMWPSGLIRRLILSSSARSAARLGTPPAAGGSECAVLKTPCEEKVRGAEE